MFFISYWDSQGSFEFDSLFRFLESFSFVVYNELWTELFEFVYDSYIDIFGFR